MPAGPAKGGIALENHPPSRKGSLSVFWKCLYIAAPFALAGLAFCLRGPVLWLSGVLPSCPFHRLTGLYCPGCGNTRGVLALMDGDLLLSLRYNISPLLILTLLALLYAEWGFRLFAKPKRLLPRSARFWILFGVAVGGYLIIRNFFPMPAAV